MVDRYSSECTELCHFPDDNGEWVHYADYEALEAKLADCRGSREWAATCGTLQAELGKLKTHYEAKLAALVDISSRAYSLLCELGSPHCNTELAIKDIAMISEEIRAALAQVKGGE